VVTNAHVMTEHIGYSAGDSRNKGVAYEENVWLRILWWFELYSCRRSIQIAVLLCSHWYDHIFCFVAIWLSRADGWSCLDFCAEITDWSKVTEKMKI